MNDYNLFKEKKKNKNMRINTKAMMMMMIGRHDMGLQSAFVHRKISQLSVRESAITCRKIISPSRCMFRS